MSEMQLSRLVETVIVTDPALATGVLRDSGWDVVDIRPHLHQLQTAGAADFALLLAVARSSLVYQSGPDHLTTRRAIASFFSPAGVARWHGAIDAAIIDALDRLAGSATPDLMRDFIEPAFLQTIASMTGLVIDDETAVLASLAAARELTEPLLSVRRLRKAEAGFSDIAARLARGYDPVDNGAPETLRQQLTATALPEGVDPLLLTTSLLIAAHTAAETLGLALIALLRDRGAAWARTTAPGWAETWLDELIRRHGSTLMIYRVAGDGAAVGGCPVPPGSAAALDMSAFKQAAADMPKSRSLVFGEGPHRCPGTALARAFIGRAIPALAGRFPALRLGEAGVRLQRNHLVETPVSLPCTGTGIRQRGARFWEVGDATTARVIATDDRRFGPPDMPSHLSALARASGEDLSVAIRIARNAPFFLSGPRQQAIRNLTLDVLGGNRLVAWIPFVDRETAKLLDGLDGRGEVDLVERFCDPLFRTVTRAVLGIHPGDPAGFDQLAPQLQDLLEPLLSLRTILRIQAVCATLLDEVAAGEGVEIANLPPSLLTRLHQQSPDDFDIDDRRALVLVLYGASFNIAHTLANMLYRLGDAPAALRRTVIANTGSGWLDAELIAPAASPRFIYRLAREDGEIDGISFARGDSFQLQLGEINVGLGASHLAFGHGLHRCLGGSLARLVLRRAVPALLGRFPDYVLAGPPTFQPLSQTVAPASLRARLS